MNIVKMTAVAALLIASQLSAALEISSCDEAGANLNGVVEMKKYANGGIKLFSIDQIEPAVAPFGVAVTIDRGNDLSDMESFCRYVSGLSDVALSTARATYDRRTNILTVKVDVRQATGDGIFANKVLTLVIEKGAATEAGLVKATIR